MTEGEKVISFIERYCRVPEGNLLNKPVELLDFQKKFILAIYDNPQHTSRAYLSIARKNAKTATIAMILLAHLVGPQAYRNSRIISGAQTRRQAAEVFNYAYKMVIIAGVEKDSSAGAVAEDACRPADERRVSGRRGRGEGRARRFAYSRYSRRSWPDQGAC